MNDVNKEIIFREGWSLDSGPFDDYLKARAVEVIALGYQYGLTLDQFDYDSEMVYFDWRGPKGAMLEWYTYQSKNMSTESEERRNAALQCISSK